MGLSQRKSSWAPGGSPRRPILNHHTIALKPHAHHQDIIHLIGVAGVYIHGAFKTEHHTKTKIKSGNKMES